MIVFLNVIVPQRLGVAWFQTFPCSKIENHRPVVGIISVHPAQGFFAKLARFFTSLLIHGNRYDALGGNATPPNQGPSVCP